jgi:hypothetical protein
MVHPACDVILSIHIAYMRLSEITMITRHPIFIISFLMIILQSSLTPCWARYNPRDWEFGPRENYPAYLTSEGVTIAVVPFFTDSLAAEVFDKDDMITRGIMPLAVIIFNDNDFPVRIDGLSVELLRGDDRTLTMPPNEVTYRLFQRNISWINRPIPPMPRSALNERALDDFIDKFLMDRTVGPFGSAGGFLYLHLPASKDMVDYLSEAHVYIPYIYRLDDGSRMIYFEISLEPAVEAIMNR